MTIQHSVAIEKNNEEYTKLYIRGMEELKAYLEAFDE